MTYMIERKTLALSILFLAVSAFGQDKPAPLTPSDPQLTKLQLAQSRAIIAVKDKQLAEVAFQQALAQLHAERDKVKKDNNWPDETIMNDDTLAFSEPVKPAPPAPKPANAK